MISKFFLLSGLIPLIGSILARKFLSDRILRAEGGGEVSLTGREIADRILKKGKASGVEIIVKKRAFPRLAAEQLVLSPDIVDSKLGKDVAEAALLAGMVLMARRQEKVVAWRAWAVKFSYAFPVFCAVTMVFAIMVGRLAPSWAIGIVCLSLGLTTLSLWLTLPVERAAAETVADLLEDSAIVPRRSEVDQLCALVKASAWQRIVPGAVGFL